MASIGPPIISGRICPTWPDWKNLQLLSEGLVSLSVMGANLRTPLKPPNTVECFDGPGGFGGAHNRVPMMPREASLSENYTPDRYSFWVWMAR